MNFQWEAIKQVIAAIVRGLLWSLGSFLVTKGYIDQGLADAFVGQLTGIVVGLLIIAATIFWKYLNAKFNILALIKAVQTDPPADDPAEIKAAVKQAQAEATADPSTLTVSA